jgi:23S rRNA (guanosine2251-2'-O)-methyltransferase
MRSIVVVAHNIRSTHNVGSLFRTCEGLGIEKLYLTGYTPYPKHPEDSRLPHLSEKINQQIHKTALDAETNLPWEYEENILGVLDKLRSLDYNLAALEQTENSTPLPQFQPPEKVALILGNEVSGLESNVLSRTMITLEIPMFGKKESFNVAQAAAIAMYHLRFWQ